MADTNAGNFGGKIVLGQEGWTEYAPGAAYRCEVHLQPLADRFKATAATLPDVTAEGTTEREALDNLTTGLVSAITARKQAGQSALGATTPTPPGASVRYVLVRL